MVKELKSTDQFVQEITNQKGYALIDFWAVWCQPCRMMAPVVEKVAEELSDLRVYKVNVDEVSSLSEGFEIMSIPTLIIFKDGNPIQRLSGYRPFDVLLHDIKEVIEQ